MLSFLWYSRWAILMHSRALKLGLLISRQGPLGMWAPSCEASALLASAELNVRGGILGRHIDLVLADAGPTHASAAEAADALIEVDGTEAIVTMIESSARRAVLNRIGGRVPIVYTPQFEGGETDPTVVAIGETSNALVGPGLDWLMYHKRATSFYLVGSDYLWPRRSMSITRSLIASRGGRVIGESIVPFGSENYDHVVQEIKCLMPDVVIFWLVGQESVNFNRKFSKIGLASSILRFSTAVEETILFAIGPESTENLYVASSYFSGLRSRNNDAFLERYHQSFGTSPPPANGIGQSLYEGIYCLNGLAEAAGNLRVADLRTRIGRAAQSRTARGNDRQIAAGSAMHPVHIAVADGHDFHILTAVR